MAFTIYVSNEGDTGTVTVSQGINLNEKTIVFNGIMEAGSQTPAQAVKTEENADERGDFEWQHAASGLTGREDVRAGEILRVE